MIITKTNGGRERKKEGRDGGGVVQLWEVETRLSEVGKFKCRALIIIL